MCEFIPKRTHIICHIDPGVDPGFLLGGDANPPDGGTNIQICQIFFKKPHEIKKILVRGVGGALSLDSPLRPVVY